MRRPIGLAAALVVLPSGQFSLAAEEKPLWIDLLDGGDLSKHWTTTIIGSAACRH